MIVVMATGAHLRKQASGGCDANGQGGSVFPYVR